MAQGDAEAVIELAQQSAAAERVREIERGKRYVLVNETGDQAIAFDTLGARDTPERPVAHLSVHSAEGFVLGVQQRRLDPAGSSPVLYGDEENMALVAVLNDDFGDQAGWRDNRVNLVLRRTPEWQLWTQNTGMRSQRDFAELIEEGLTEIVEPNAATMLDLAQHFIATIEAEFKQGGVLADGSRQYRFEEKINAKAGEGGTLEIPGIFVLNVRPFFGSAPIRVEARLRTAIVSGHLQMGYLLTRVVDVERAAFGSIRDAVTEQLGLDVIAGVAPGVAPVFNGVSI